MSHNLACHRCGASLSALSLPLSRRDQCPDCSADLHVCKMCIYYDKTVPRQCLEDGADDVKDKDRPSFCDWFKPSENAFNASANAEAEAARDALTALFGDDS